jgi:trehalose 6-phosphate phosphatase
MPPSALDLVHEIIAGAGGKRPAVFLDYDGTLTPIANHPEEAWLGDSMRQTLRSLAARVPVAILSGRDLDDVRGRVLVDGIIYAGSHGFDIAAAGGLRRELGARICPFSTKQRWNCAKRSMKFQARSWNGNIFLSPRIIAM